MEGDAYDDILHGNGYHLLRGVISPDEADTVRSLTLSKLDEGIDQNGQIAIRKTLIGDPSSTTWSPILGC